jgi:hypothetical protein
MGRVGPRAVRPQRASCSWKTPFLVILSMLGPRRRETRRLYNPKSQVARSTAVRPRLSRRGDHDRDPAERSHPLFLKTTGWAWRVGAPRSCLSRAPFRISERSSIRRVGYGPQWIACRSLLRRDPLRRVVAHLGPGPSDAGAIIGGNSEGAPLPPRMTLPPSAVLRGQPRRRGSRGPRPPPTRLTTG